MDVIWSLILLVIIVGALASMVGGRPGNFFMPVLRGLGKTAGGLLAGLTGAAGTGVKSGLGVSSSEPMKPRTFGAPDDPEQ